MADRRGVDQVLDSTLFNRLIISADRCEHSEKASDLQTPVEEKKKTHFNGRTFRTLFRACVKSRDVNRCSILHAEIARFRLLHTNPSIGTFLVDMYAKFGLPTKAEAVLEEIPNADTATWNALISGYIKHDQGHEALKCFIRMQIKGVPADAITYICVVKACGITCSVEKGKSIHDEVKNKGLIKSHVKLGNALVDMYVKFGMLEEAQEVFNQISIRDVVSWNTLIAGYTKQGESEKAIECFEQLQLEDLHPDSISFVCTLKACGSIGAIQKGIEIHNFILKRGLLQTDLAIA